MRAEITFNGDGTAASRYVGWAPVPAESGCRIQPMPPVR